MITISSPDYGAIELPATPTTLDSFLRWRQSDRVPDRLKACFYRGKVWVDLYMEEFFSHNQIKAAIGISLGGFVREADLGTFVPDGMLLKNPAADLSTTPDAMFISHESFATRRVRLEAGKRRDGRATVLVGSPDVVIEVVSSSSEDIDSEWLMRAYHDAGVREYWLIDGRNVIQFDIYKRTAREFVSVKKTSGWVRSPVFDRAFRLTRSNGNRAVPVYTLAIR